MFNLFNKKKPILQSNGYILVVAFDTKTLTSVNYVYNKETNTFDKKSLFAATTIHSDSKFSTINEAFASISKKKEHKRFLASKNIEGIYYVETSVVERPEGVYISETTTSPLFYVPSSMSLYIDAEKPTFKNDNKYNQK